MSNIIHLIFTPMGPKACFKGLTLDEVSRKFKHKNSKHYITGGTYRKSSQEITVYLQRK